MVSLLLGFIDVRTEANKVSKDSVSFKATSMSTELPYIALSPLAKMALRDNFHSKDFRDFPRSYKYPFSSTA